MFITMAFFILLSELGFRAREHGADGGGIEAQGGGELLVGQPFGAQHQQRGVIGFHGRQHLTHPLLFLRAREIIFRVVRRFRQRGAALS